MRIIVFFALYVFCKEQTTYNQGYVSCCKFVKELTAKHVFMNDYMYVPLNAQDCSFLMFWNRGCTQTLVVSRKYWVLPLMSTKVSGYSQVILFGSSLIHPILNSSMTAKAALTRSVMIPK